ncbi:hypothetical protein Tco_0218191 [Tanacetum coccineum]
MDTTRAQQQALDDEIVAPADLALDALKLTPFYNAFEIFADVPEIYMQELWVTVTRHHSSLRFKLNGKSHTVNVDNFRDMLKIFPKIPGQIFEEPPLEEEILSFIRDLGHTGEIKVLSDVNVNHMHQPWRSFAAIINKCLSGKTTTLESLRLSRAQIIWGMYHNKTVDYVYLLWEDLVLLHGKGSRNSKEKQDHLTNQAMLEFEAYMTYRAYSTGEKIPKPKTTKKKADFESSPKTKPTQASKGKRIKTLATRDKPAKKKQSATKSKGDGVDIRSKVPDEQQQNVCGTNKGAGDKPEVPDVPEYRSNSEEDSWTYSQGEDEDDNEEHDSENDNDDKDDDQENVDDQEDERDEEKANDDDEVSSDQMVSTPPDYEITEEEENQEDDDNVMGGEQEDVEDEELYGYLNLNLERRDAEMTDAQVNQEKEEVHVTFTTELPVVQQQSSYVSSDLVSKFMNPTPDTVSVTSATPSSDTTIPQTPIPIIQTQQQTHDSTTTTTIPATTLPNIPNFASQFAVSSILGIVDNYLASKMKDEVNVAIQLQSNKLREEAQAENEEFLNQIDSNIKAIIKDQIMEFFGYKHLEEIAVRRQDDRLYKFREGDFKRLHRQDIEDMLLLLVQGKLTNLNLDEHFALNVALRMYTRCIVIQERMEDLQLAVESYQKKINLSRPDSYRSDLRNMTPYTAYLNIQGIIYQDDMDKNRLMRTDKLHKFSDGTLNHVCTALKCSY